MNESSFENPFLKKDSGKPPMKMAENMLDDFHNSRVEKMENGKDWNLRSVAKVDPMASLKRAQLEMDGWILDEDSNSESSIFWVYEKVIDSDKKQGGMEDEYDQEV